ncbi:MAG: HNH endonuclease family protein [Rubrobacteraceae bacterium]
MGTVFEYSEGNKEETIKELHHVWGEIYRWVGLNQGMSSESLRFAATLKSADRLSKVQSEEAAVETLRELAGNSAKGTIEVSNWILKVVKAVDKLVADKRRTAVTKIAHARLLAVAIELSSMSDSQRDELLNVWEKVTFRIFGMCRRDARTGVGYYVRLARKLFIEGMEHEDALNAIRALGTGDFAIESAVEQLRHENSYEGWEEELRYFMYRYEEHLAREQGLTFSNEQWERIWEDAPAKSIEHISPQSRGRSYVHRLGNLTLLPPRLNSKLRDMSSSKKAKDYEKTGLLITAELKPDLNRWKLDSVKKREERLLKWAKQEWAD